MDGVRKGGGMNRQVEEARTRTLKKIRAKITQDQRRASHLVARFLQVLKLRPFESSLTMEEARKEAGIRDNNFPAQFRKELDVGPYVYRQRLQVEAGDAMIEEGLQVPTALVLAAVGLSSYSLAREAYRRCSRHLKIYRIPYMEIRIDYYNYSLLRRGKLSEDRARGLISLLEDGELCETVEDELPCQDDGADVMSISLAEVQKQIHRDRVLVPIGLDKILRHIAENLTNSQLNATTAVLAVKVRDESIGDKLKFYLGSTIKVYIDKSRVRLIAHRLGETAMSVPETGVSAGIDHYATLAGTFKRCSGERPMDIRQPAVETGLTYDTWMRAGLGDFDAVRETIAVLRPFVPEVSKEPTIAVESFERWYAETQIWPTLRKMSLEEAREEVRHSAIAGMALVNLLRQKSREEGRGNHQRGIHLAKLALNAVLNVKLLSGDALKEEIAKGWAWVGNAYRLALDFVSADDAFKKVFEELRRREIEGPSSIEGEIYDLKASLRVYQRRHEEAIELAEMSLRSFRAVGDQAGEVIALETRAIACDYAGMPEAALADFMKILTLQPNDGRHTFSAHYSMAIVLEKSEKYERAAEALQSAKEIRTENQLWLHHLSWIEATIHHGLRRFDLAESDYREAVEGFAALNEMFYSTLASLDLAILCLDLGRYPEAIEFSSVIVSFFSALNLNTDAFTALQVLGRSLRELSLTRDTLLDLRDIVRRDPTLPGSRKLGPG